MAKVAILIDLALIEPLAHFGFLKIVNIFKLYPHSVNPLGASITLNLLTIYKHLMLSAGVKNQVSFNDFFGSYEPDVD